MRPEALCAEFTGVLSWNEYQVITYCPSEVRLPPPELELLELELELVELLELLELVELLDELLELVPPPQLASLTVTEVGLKDFDESVE